MQPEDGVSTDPWAPHLPVGWSVTYDHYTHNHCIYDNAGQLVHAINDKTYRDACRTVGTTAAIRDIVRNAVKKWTSPQIQVHASTNTNSGVRQSYTSGAKWTVLKEPDPWTPLDTGVTEEDHTTMLELMLKLYTTAMRTGVTSPMPHLVGPPGCGKSYTIDQLAKLLGVNLHIVNVSRISPLGLEGIEMPIEKNTKLKLLLAEMWAKAKPGDIYLFDEFLRGFPEVYNGLLDIFTAREVAGHKLPPVFIVGASNSVTTYDGALEDRLLHIPVEDPRAKTKERRRIMQLLIDQLGLHPSMATSSAMDGVMTQEVLPTYEILDKFNGTSNTVHGSTRIKGTSVRKLIGQAKLRHVLSPSLRSLIEDNNRAAISTLKFQYILLLDGVGAHPSYIKWAKGIKPEQLAGVLRENLEINLQLIEMEEAKAEATANTTTTQKEDPDVPDF